MAIRNKLFKNIKAVITDIDGTILDSMGVWKDADVLYLKNRGFDYPADLYRCLDGMSMEQSCIYLKDRFDLTESPQEIEAGLLAIVQEKYETSIPLKPGALDFLQFLKKNRLRIAAVTGNRASLVTAALTRLGAIGLFDKIVSSDDGFIRKEDGTVYAETAEALGIVPSQCLALDDSVKGIAGAKKAGMRTLGVLDANSKEMHPLLQKTADDVIRTYFNLELR